MAIAKLAVEWLRRFLASHDDKRLCPSRSRSSRTPIHAKNVRFSVAPAGSLAARQTGSSHCRRRHDSVNYNFSHGRKALARVAGWVGSRVARVVTRGMGWPLVGHQLGRLLPLQTDGAPSAIPTSRTRAASHATHTSAPHHRPCASRPVGATPRGRGLVPLTSPPCRPGLSPRRAALSWRAAAVGRTAGPSGARRRRGGGWSAAMAAASLFVVAAGVIPVVAGMSPVVTTPEYFLVSTGVLLVPTRLFLVPTGVFPVSIGVSPVSVAKPWAFTCCVLASAVSSGWSNDALCVSGTLHRAAPRWPAGFSLALAAGACQFGTVAVGG